MKNFLVSVSIPLVITICFLTGLIAFQLDIANFFGISSVTEPKLSILKDLLLPFFAALGGAGGGAWIAFKLQTENEERRLSERKLSIINRTLFTLHKQLTDLLNIKAQSFVSEKKNPLRFLSIPFEIESFCLMMS